MSTAAATFDPFDRTFLGQPRSLITLFMTELWERFSYYGMRAILVLFLIAPESNGGLGMSAAQAAGIYGIYVALVYLTPLPGGWLGDRLLGPRRAVIVGGIVIAAGHIVLAGLGGPGLFLALLLIVLGTGLLKPNMTAMVGELYDRHDDLRDAGFSFYYMGINLGAFLAPLVCGYLGQEVSWELGFGVAAAGMFLGLGQFVIGMRGMGNLGVAPDNPMDDDRRRSFYRQCGIGAVVIAGIVALDALVINASADAIELLITIMILIVPVVWFSRTLRRERSNRTQFNKVLVLLALFVAAAVFWMVYDQAGSTLSIFAEQDTNNSVLGFDFPSSWFQSVNPIAIIILAPILGMVWTALAVRGHQPPTAIKFSMGLFLVALSMVVMVFAAEASIDGKVAAMWLFAVYSIQTLGELLVSPIGMSAATRLAPPDAVSQTLGVWFLATSVGDAVGGQLAGLYDSIGHPEYFALLGGITVIAALAMLVLAKPLGRLAPD